jgi:glycosyltransferase involved in cell wall biosynthesis
MFFWQLSPLVLPLLRAFPVVHHVQMYNAICPLGTKMLPDGQLCHEPSGLACLRNRCFSPQAWAAVMWQRRLWRKWSSSVNLIVAVSDWVRRRLIAEGTPVDLVVWNGVPPRPQAVPAGPPAVVFAGRLVREKGVDTLLRAFARIVTRVPDAILQIAGDGPERMRIESLIRELGLQRSVSMLGFLPRDEMEKRFHSARVQAVPGTWEEPFGLVTAEAMMRGTPVIATARGAATEKINPGVTGLLVPAGDPEALTAALITSLLDADSARAMGRAAREFALERLTESAMVERFLTIYSDLLSGFKPGLLSRDRND